MALILAEYVLCVLAWWKVIARQGRAIRKYDSLIKRLYLMKVAVTKGCRTHHFYASRRTSSPVDIPHRTLQSLLARIQVWSS